MQPHVHERAGFSVEGEGAVGVAGIAGGTLSKSIPIGEESPDSLPAPSTARTV